MALKMERRELYTPVFHIDTNMINARGKLAEMNKLEKWAEDEVRNVDVQFEWIINTSLKDAKRLTNQQKSKKEDEEFAEKALKYTTGSEVEKDAEKFLLKILPEKK